MKAVKNSLLPSVDLFAYYGGQGLGGSQNPANVCGDPRSIPGICTPHGEVFLPSASVERWVNFRLEPSR